MNIKIPIATFLLFTSAVSLPAYSQNVIVDQSSVNLQSVPNSNLFETLEPVYLGVNVQSWEITCIAEPLIHELNSTQLSSDQLYIRHDLVTDFQQFNTAIDLGSGSTDQAAFESIINTLYFRLLNFY